MEIVGIIEHVNLRSVWLDESADFTPWLAQSEHLKALGSSLNMNLVVQTTEHYVGSYKADILARDLETDTLVVIENQLEPANHSHLGQLITYVSGIENVGTAIWIASYFDDEHIAALTWINDLSDKVQVFGVEIELLKIGESLPAPVFNVIVSPMVKARRSYRVRTKKTLPQGEGNTSLAQSIVTEWVEQGKKSATVDEILNLTGHHKRTITNAIRAGKLVTASRNKELVLVSSLIEWLRTTPMKQETETSFLHLVNE